jgi:two-component system, cell cycle response regulator
MSSRVFTLALFGFSGPERRVITSVISLAAGRGRPYLLAADDTRHMADIAIVDWGDRDAVAQWQKCLQRDAPLPALMIAEAPDAVPGSSTVITRPITVKRLLEGLDNVTIRTFRYVPELTIQDDTAAAMLSRTTLEAAGRAAQSSSRSGVRALVVDDSAPVRKLIGIQLGLFGIEADFSSSGEDALNKMERETYDIVFLDLTLPGMDGYAVCKSIKRSRTTRAVPVVMLTGRGSRIDRIRGTMAGCSAYLTKPVAQDDLKHVIEKLITEDPHAYPQGAHS